MASGKFQPALNFRMLPAKLTAPFHLSRPHRFGTVARPSPSSPEPEYSMEQGLTQAKHPAIQRGGFVPAVRSLPKPGFPWLSDEDNNSPSPQIIYKTC